MNLLKYLVLFLSLCLMSAAPPKEKSAKFDVYRRAGALISAGVVASTAIIYSMSTTPLYINADAIPDKVIKSKGEISGKIVEVLDGDTYRLRHMPSIFSSDKFQGNMKANTITVRIAAVDTPETAKRGNPGQAFGEEAKNFATQKVFSKKVTVKCLSRDQYGRLIGRVRYSDSFFSNNKDISEELLKQGYAVVYRQGGAQYDGNRQQWENLELRAKQTKKGIWGSKKIELPSEYKKKLKKQQQQQQQKVSQ